jgi:7-carboxy-7-deazaguanine synthase
MKVKVSELFYSLQGEGERMGTPSIFLRLFGCNFTCSGFGMAVGKLSEERLNVDPDNYQIPEDYKKLPLVHTGCDSYASWDVRFKHLSPMMEIDAVVEKIGELLPNGTFGDEVDLVVTGGEPLLGWQRAFPELFRKLQEQYDLKNITFETNGTQPLQPALVEEFDHYNVTWAMSVKLSSSGEKFEERIQPSVIQSYLPHGNAFFKFVVSNPEDIQEVEETLAHYSQNGVANVITYLMPAGGTTLLYDKNLKWVAEECMSRGFRLSPRLQVTIWKNAWGT